MKNKKKVTSVTELSYKEKMKKEYINLVYECRKYHYKAEYKFNCFYIYTKFELWCYELINGRRKLMHGNLLFQNGNGKEGVRWHRQKLSMSSSLKEIVTYIHEHEGWKYGPL